MVVFPNVDSVDRIVYAIFSRFNEDWKTTPSNYLHKQLDVISVARKRIVVSLLGLVPVNGHSIAKFAAFMMTFTANGKSLFASHKYDPASNP